MADLCALADLATPWCVHVAATLRIAQHIDAGATGIDALAQATGCDRDALHCVLSHLVSRGVFVEPTRGEFGLNDTARQFLEPAAAFLDLAGIGGRMAHTWGTLPEWVRSGRPAYEQRFGLPFWEDLAAHPELAASFDALMGPAGHGRPDPGIRILGGWERVRSVVDVGGGTGALLAEILRAHPAVQGTLVDLPGPVARAADTFAAAGVSDRARTVAQSFFDPLPPGADVYLLWKVLNDWPAEETTVILRRCAEAARPNGTVLVRGGVSADDAPPQLGIDMLVAGGRTDSLDVFRELAGGAGLSVAAADRQPVGFVVECRPR